MTEITKDMLIGDILDADRGTAKYFLEMGMHCLGCPASQCSQEKCRAPGLWLQRWSGRHWVWFGTGRGDRYTLDVPFCCV